MNPIGETFISFNAKSIKKEEAKMLSETKPRLSGNNVIEGTDFNFDQEVLKSETPVLVDFWAPWCGPCRAIAPIVEELASEYEGKLKVVKLNTDENQDVAIKYGIRSIPTLGIFKDGKVVDAVIGTVPKNHLESKIKPYLAIIN
jgi:thioredoxin 1